MSRPGPGVLRQRADARARLERVCHHPAAYWVDGTEPLTGGGSYEVVRCGFCRRYVASGTVAALRHRVRMSWRSD